MEVVGIRDLTVETGKETYSIKTGKNIDIPQWLAFFLEEEGVVKVKTYDNKYYQRLIIEERKNKKLASLDKNFYEISMITLKKAAPEQKRKIMVSLRQLIDLRLQKLMQLAIQDAEIEIPHMERILYNRVKEEIRNWFKDMEGIFDGDRL